MSEVKASGNGIGIGTLLFVVFLVLKLTGVVAWSWWWVTAPLWLPAIIALVVALIAFLVYIKFK